ncbi:hypothetical protein BS78_K341500 [Paspalum vaginatum]|uniref:DUF7792 domain-containing protein n=1 Tax=Paspalum vaginatum TaxID=158149 RepID=A0A9W7XE26_9POAL|nr:hypothetical protein BS78_K341500 [Paspalum vaginatum]
MEPVSALSAVFMLVLKISAAANKASKRKVKCRELAEHASILAEIIRRAFAPNAVVVVTEDTRRVVRALRKVLEQALELVNSCQGGQGMLRKIFNVGGPGVDKFDDMEKKLDRRVQSVLLQLQVDEMQKKVDKVLRVLGGMVKTGDTKLSEMEKKMDRRIRSLQKLLIDTAQRSKTEAAGADGIPREKHRNKSRGGDRLKKGGAKPTACRSRDGGGVEKKGDKKHKDTLAHRNTKEKSKDKVKKVSDIGMDSRKPRAVKETTIDRNKQVKRNEKAKGVIKATK